MRSKPAGKVSTATVSTKVATTASATRPATSEPPQEDAPMLDAAEEATGSLVAHRPTQETQVVRSTVNTRAPGAPRLTKSMNSEYFNRSKISTAYALQKEQNFGKDTVNQSFTCDKSFLHVVLFLCESKLLIKEDLKRIWILIPATRRLWRDWKQSRKVTTEEFESLRKPSPNWQNQERIDDKRVALRLSLLLHLKLDLAAVQRYLGGQHTAAHRDPDVILPQVQGLVSEKVFNDVERIMRFGAPAQFNEHGSREQFIEYRDYGNHKSVQQNHKAFSKAMNKEDKRDYVLTFPAYIKNYIPDLWLTPNGLVQIPGKKDRVIFDASFRIHADSRPYNSCITNEHEPDIYFGGAWTRYLSRIYNLRISFPDSEILLFDDDVVSAFRQIKYHPNVLSSKGHCNRKYLFIQTALTFGDKSSPPEFEPFAGIRTALGTDLNATGQDTVPEYSDYLDAVQFAPPPPIGIVFAQARPDKFNQGVLDENGNQEPTEYNMHVDDNLYAEVGEERMRWAMRCSIHSLNIIMGGCNPTERPNPTDFDKFVRETVSHRRCQIGCVTDTRLMTVTIPDEKREAILTLLRQEWGPHRRSFTLLEAARLLGTLISLSRVCSWGLFLFVNLNQAIYEMLTKNAKRLMLSSEFRELIQQRDGAAGHPTEAARFRFFSSKVARAIWNCKSRSWITVDIRTELTFIAQVLGNPTIYDWSSPIAHLIELEPDYEEWQDACLTGGGGFSFNLRFWWILEWPSDIANRTVRYLPKGDKRLISINKLEYASIIFSLAASILSWEALPVDQRPIHPMILSWTDNTTAEAWTRKIAGLTGPQGKSMARIFAHLLMFSNVGVRAAYIKGEENPIADYLSRLRDQNNFSQFQYDSLVTQFPRLKQCRRFLPSPELLSLVYSALSTGHVTIPDVRVPLGRIEAD